jgi:hypothetical protein
MSDPAGRGSALRQTRGTIRVECLHCRHIGHVSDAELLRHRIRLDAPIASFIKRLRCRKCGSHSVRAKRVHQQKAS